ncbi:MAG: HAMP domain-containing sensor histidine kinase [Lachnospiraceae bacterium]|nr:HAMP domain-containing sensor histidine kinase [Lachnospiraceae bacterium]MDD3616041.1 HAMP domain-containing sensor histidine kinase [Lachnospiraceae bacterium]
MTMKKRIFISNTAIVLVSLLILFGVFGGAFGIFKDEYMSGMEQEAGLADHIYDIQTLLMEEQKIPDSWEALSQKAGAYNYELYVTDMENKVQYSNVRHSEEEFIEAFENTAFSSEQVKLYNMEGVTIARCIITADGTDYNVYVACSETSRSLWGMDRGMFEMFIIVFVIMGIIVIAGLLFCSQIFTKRLINKIMKPVEELNHAAQRINQGDLDTPITYDEKDEFLEVCSTFNTMQQNLKAGMEQNAAYEKARTEMVSGISHDLRTPLTSVKGYVKGMLDGIANTPEKQQRYLEMSYQKACDMDELLQKLFYFSKLETGNMPFFLQKTELNSWMEKYISEKQIEAEEKGYSITLKKEIINCFVQMDVEQMKRVFDNLIENSLKYADASVVEISASMEKRDKDVVISVKDNGNGIDDEKLLHVFEQFYRGDESRTSKNDGSGLGLYVCKYIVEEHGGTITAKNQNGFLVEIELTVEE